MGYGHLRAAHNLAESLHTEVIRMDLPPVAGRFEAALWRGMRGFYNILSRTCDSPAAGPAAQAILEQMTGITPLSSNGRLETANLLSRLADCLTRNTFGQHLRAIAARTESPVVAAYPVAAMAARHAPGARIFCLTTDTDLNRAWAPPDSHNSTIEYFATVPRVMARLRSFGVPAHRIHLTGFPLPATLVSHASEALARRLHRLDPEGVLHGHPNKEILSFLKEPKPASKHPVTLTLAVGGAGGQLKHVRQIFRSVQKRILSGELRLVLVAGTRTDVAEDFYKMVRATGLAPDQNEVEILFSPEYRTYFRQFEDCLANTDVLWTKPSELVFYAALGLPILLAPPVGGQEHANRTWLLSNDAALDAGDPSLLDLRLQHWLTDGELCRVAWNAYSRLDREGLDRIHRILNTGARVGDRCEAQRFTPG